MVLPGQYLERSVVVRSGDLALDGLYHRGRVTPPCAVAPPHPALGGSMTAPVVAELAWALTRAGRATLRFDYRGVGASQGESRHAAGSLVPGAALSAAALADELADLRAAVELLCGTVGASTACAVGVSFGAAVALAAAADPVVERLVLVAPPTAVFDFTALRALSKPALVVCAHRDPLSDRTLLQGLCSATTRLEIIPHSDASFGRGLTELGKLVAAWLRGGEPEHVAPPDEPFEEAGPLRELELEEGAEAPLELDD